MTLDEYFAEQAESRHIFDVLAAAVEGIGEVQLRISKSQIAFARRTVFARAWMPGTYLGRGHARLVLTLSFHHRDASPRWKQIVEPYPGRFTHHLELFSAAQIDDQVCEWLRAAWVAAA